MFVRMDGAGMCAFKTKYFLDNNNCVATDCIKFSNMVAPQLRAKSKACPRKEMLA